MIRKNYKKVIKLLLLQLLLPHRGSCFREKKKISRYQCQSIQNSLKRREM